MAANYISEFYIKDLFGERNVRITFDSDYKILVAENGYGKTTILNLFYALVSGDIPKLTKMNFSKIGVIFSDKIEVAFNRYDIDLLNKILVLESETKIDNNPNLLQKINIQVELELKKILDAIDKEILFGLLKHVNLQKIEEEQKRKVIVRNKLNNIQKIFSLKKLYLPTYRRIEEDIRVSVNSFQDNNYLSSSINFGMGDVKDTINRITSEITNSSIAWFSKINGQMLSQLVDGVEVTDEMKAAILKPRAIEIVLERIGENIPESNKEKILNLLKTKKISKNHEPLIYLVANLLKVYEKQQDNDSAIQAFTSVCNKYLRDKEIIYDESNVKIEIIRKKSKKLVDMENLSSGEKQIISLFAMLYLQKETDFAIFFDEPELSLSIEWQRMLLPDIINSGKCKFLFCTTHSPFIFDNDLQQYTVDLAEYIEE